MKTITFLDFNERKREDLLVFSETYKKMIQELFLCLSVGKTIELYLGRISDTGIEIGSSTRFLITGIEQNLFHTEYISPTHEEVQKKTIRTDNVLGELPILPGYEKMPKFFKLGEGFKAYTEFVDEVRTNLKKEVGENITLVYRNDDGSFSLIEGKLKEVNKGNIFMQDYREMTVQHGKSCQITIGLSRNKNHRFVSQTGFLCKVMPEIFGNDQITDDGEVFGVEEKVWNFLYEKV